MVIGNDVHPRETFLKIRHGVVVGVVIYHHHLRIDTLDGSLHTMKTLLHVVLHVVIDDNDSEFFQLCFLFIFEEVRLLLTPRLTGIDEGKDEQ